MFRHPATQLALTALIAGCSSERDLPDGAGGVHPAGWADEMSEVFHGIFLRDNGFSLEDCRTCHGDDFAGGPVDVGCAGNGCHTDSLDRCGTCHGERDDPRPTTGAHAPHAAYCETCHPVPDSLASAEHLDGTVDLMFSGLAVAGGATPSWDGESCNGTYCHGDGAPGWEDTAPPGCGGCHTAPPGSHARFARVATEEGCTDCHADPAGATHVNGDIDFGDFGDPTCNACHGGPDGSPPIGLDGATDPAAPSVGAHVRHVNPTAADRIGRVVPCASCHPIPEGVMDPLHLDDAAPADVILVLGGAYDDGEQRCTVWCHWDRDPGPTWTDDSGAATACDACHGFPPVTTRVGTPHPPALPSQCSDCHAFSSLTHVDGEVDFQ